MLRDLVLRSHPAAVSMLYALTFTVLGLSFGHGLRHITFPALWISTALVLALTVLLAGTRHLLIDFPALDAPIRGTIAYLLILITFQGFFDFLFSLPSILPNFLLTWLTLAFAIRVPLRRNRRRYGRL